MIKFNFGQLIETSWSSLSLNMRQKLTWLGSFVVALGLFWIVNTFLIRIEYCSSADSTVNLELVNIAKSVRRMRLGSNVVVKFDNNSHCSHVRIVGLPGDTVSLVDGCAMVNGEYIDRSSSIKSTFRISQGLSFKFRHRMSRDAGVQLADTAQYTILPINLRVKNWLRYTYAPLLPNMPSKDVYPFDIAAHNNVYNMHRFRLPMADDTITIDARNLLYYGSIISKYEHNPMPNIGDVYIFEHSYFWLLNDNRDIYNDSRTLGPLPESQILGTIL